MNTCSRLVTRALFLLPALFATASLLAQHPIDGTWRINYDQSKLSQEPDVIFLDKGIYTCSSCTPKISIKADGTDQPVAGHAFDTLSVREVDSKTIAAISKKDGKLVAENMVTVSDDGNTVTSKTTFHPPNGSQPVESEETSKRIGKAPTGPHAISGSWQTSKLAASDNGRIFTYKVTGEELSFTDPTGASYTAKLDGKDYPVSGSVGWTSVSVKRIGARTIEETDKRDGKAYGVWKITADPDVKKLIIVTTNLPSGDTSTLVAERQ